MRMVVTAPRAKVYGKSLSAGQEFDCPDKEAKLWAALAWAHPVSPVRTVEITRTDGDPVTFAAADEDAPPKRRGRPPGSYNRRDMRADED
ncbi:hypothetical protein [Bradyrhizobium elkanii]|uniref:hypothetical protein n=1 Tax=Bradyrhizobium elkanii TaxID=29448 RepID=UPI0027295A9C|nr:hypothetical protein [Bradyrhizobium elkanii]WLA80299.1 hypothetical protein QNJ99_33680 [Bradyrhizobium elkanii]